MAEKRATHRFGRSLTARIMAVTLAFLILPLILYSLYSYRQDFKDKRKEIVTSLEYLAQGEVLMMEELLIARFQFLDGLSQFSNRQGLTSAGLLKFNEQLVGQKEGNEILFVTKQGERYICQASSATVQIDQDYTDLIASAKESLQSYLVFAGNDPGQQENTVYLAKRVDSGYYILSYPAARMLTSLTILRNSDYPTNLTVIDGQKNIIATSDAELKGQSFKEGAIELTTATEHEGLHFIYKGQTHIALMRPVPFTNFTLIFDVPERLAFTPLNRFIQQLMLPFILLIFFGLIASFFLVRRISKPLQQLASVMERVGGHDLKARFQPDRFGYEINRVGAIFNEMIDDLLRQMEARRTSELQKEAYLKELKIGQELQLELLPVALPHVNGVEVAARFVAAQEVSGDFYDLFVRPDGLLQIVIGDVSGKGIHACFHGLMLRSIMRSLSDRNCDEMIARANKLFSHDTEKSSTFATMWVGLYDLKSHELTYSCLGHHPPFLWSASGDSFPLQTDGMALGVIDGLSFEVKKYRLSAGDILFLYTDGLVERDNIKGELYGEGRLKTFLGLHYQRDPEVILDSLFEEMAFFGEGKPLPDDLSLVIFKRANQGNP